MLIYYFKRIISLIIVLAVYLVLSSNLVLAQDRLVSDFEFQYEKYRQQYTEYEAARNEFLKANTLITQNIAIDKTKQLLLQRAQVLRTYFLALKFKINSNLGIAKDDQIKFSNALDDEIGWLQSHMDDLSKVQNPTLNDLFEISKRLERKETDYRVLTYQTLTMIMIGKIQVLNQELVAISTELKPYIDQTGVNYLQNWLFDAQNSAYQSMKNVDAATALLPELKRRGSNETQIIIVYSDIQSNLETANANIQKGVGFQKEIIKDLDKRLGPTRIGDIINKNATTSSDIK